MKEQSLITNPRTDYKQRAEEFERRYRRGDLLEEIAADYGISRERVRQVLAARGVSKKDGGQRVKAERRHVARVILRDRLCRKLRGCNYRQYVTAPRAAKRAYYDQKKNAHNRGIEWRLTFWQWWQFWCDSGKWKVRGRGQGWVMCRDGDQGAYEIGNVRIDTGRQNSSEGSKKDVTLPIGVTHHPTSGYLAKRMIAGKNYRLGRFNTIKEAAAAYERCGREHNV